MLPRTLFLCLLLLTPSAFCEEIPASSERSEFKDEIQRDFSLRNLGPFQITNMRGDVELKGWALDKVRVLVRRRVKAENAEKAKVLAATLDVRFQTVDKHLELSVEYGKGMSLAERIRDRANPQTSASITVWGPSHLMAKVWTTGGAVHVQGWNAPLEVRSSEGMIRIEQIKGDSISLLCPTCSMSAHSVRGSLRVMGGVGTVELFGVKGSPVYVETASGAVKSTRVSGDQLYVTQSGPVSGQDLSGGIEFHTVSGEVKILDSSGSLSGKTESGTVLATFRAWKFRDKSIVESSTGVVDLALPAEFSGELELLSGSGKPEISEQMRFQLESGVDNSGLDRPEYGPPTRYPSLTRWIGRLGDGGEILRVVSHQNKVRLRRFGTSSSHPEKK